MFPKPTKQVILSLARLGQGDPILQRLLNHTMLWGDIPEEPVVLDEEEMERRAFVARFKAPVVPKRRTIRFSDDFIQEEVEPISLYKEVANMPIVSLPLSEPVSLSEPLPMPIIDIPFQVVKTKKHEPQFPFAQNPNRIHTVIVRNLPRDITTPEIHQCFSAYGTILDVYMPKNMDTTSPYFGTLKGFALIKYTKPIESARAVAAGPLQFKMNNVMIEFAKADR